MRQAIGAPHRDADTRSRVESATYPPASPVRHRGRGEESEMADLPVPDALRDDLRAAWHRYIDLLAPLRPALHGYCRRLTGNVWDAEDLVQDTLLRAFGTFGCVQVAI